jgi:ferric-dicitrate binding protein FerR (iron transport regulator)
MEQAFHLISGTEKIQPDKEKVWPRINIQPTNQSNNLRWIYGITAVFIVGLVAVVFLIKNDQISPSEIYASEKSIQQTLDDNSIINLEKNGRITLDNDFGKTNRKLSLSGKATFKVTHDDSKPFIIESKGVFIEDLGTLFRVESMPDSDTVYVVVNEGIVRLYDEHGSEIIIKAGEKAWYIRSQKKIITSLDTKVMKFDFKDTKLSEAINLLSDTYDADIRLYPSSIGECLITTQFFDEELATIITVITETLGFKYEYQDHHYIITGKPCK